MPGARVRLVLLGVLAAAPSCAEPEPPPNVLLVSLDTTRADHLSALGYERPTTPEIDAFAADAVTFEAAYAPASTTSPSHATMFTGRYPVSHGVVRNGLDLADDHRTLAEHLGAAGYRTGAVVSSFVLHSRFGFGQGFAAYDDELPEEEALPRGDERDTFWGIEVDGGFDRQASFATDRALAWLRDRDPERPFFLFVHYMDPHNRVAPYEPYWTLFSRAPQKGADPYDAKVAHEIDRYDAMVAWTDHHLGRLLEELDASGLRDDTLVVVTGDHGEGLMQHGYRSHGVQIYEESVRVPFFVRWPGRIEGGRRFAEPVALVDLAPTVLELAGVAHDPAAFQGESLGGVLLGDDELDPEREVFFLRRPFRPGKKAGIRVNGPLHGLRAGRWKYIWGPDEDRSELYDLEADPDERVDLSGREPERVAAMRARLESWVEANTADQAENTTTDADLRKLEALGYTE